MGYRMIMSSSHIQIICYMEIWTKCRHLWIYPWNTAKIFSIEKSRIVERYKRSSKLQWKKKALAGDFTQGSIANKLIRFMIPILGALVLQAMYGAVDLLVVGQFGTDAGISAVSTGSNVINLVTFVISELTMGVTVLIGRYLGENRNERIGKVIGGAIVFFAIMAAVLMVLLLAFAPQFASWLNAPKEAYDRPLLISGCAERVSYS